MLSTSRLFRSASGNIWTPAFGTAGTIARAALDLVFPPTCLACREAGADAGALCAACWREIRFIERPFCERLGTPFPVDLDAPGLLSPEAIAHPPAFARARAVAHLTTDRRAAWSTS